MESGTDRKGEPFQVGIWVGATAEGKTSWLGTYEVNLCLSTPLSNSYCLGQGITQIFTNLAPYDKGDGRD